MRNLVTHQPFFNSYPVQYCEQGNRTDILLRIESILSGMLTKHSQVLVAGMNFHYPDDGLMRDPSNQTFTNFLESLIRNYTRKGFDPRFIWGREMSGNGKPHWHLTLFLNANNIRHLKHGYIKSLWNKHLGIDMNSGSHYVEFVNLSDDGKHMGLIVHRNDSAAITQAFHKISYLAKCEQKLSCGSKYRQFGSSQV